MSQFSVGPNAALIAQDSRGPAVLTAETAPLVRRATPSRYADALVEAVAAQNVSHVVAALRVLCSKGLLYPRNGATGVDAKREPPSFRETYAVETLIERELPQTPDWTSALWSYSCAKLSRRPAK